MRIVVARISFLLLAGFPTVALAQEVVHFDPTVGYPTFAVRDPVLRIQPNTELHSRTNTGPYYEPGGGDFPGEVGPFFVEGAEPGDTLVVEIIEVIPNMDTAGAQISPDFGGLASDYRLRLLNDPIPFRRYEWRIDRKAMTGTLDLPDSESGAITINLKPMLGRVAVAPRGEEAFGGLWPGDGRWRRSTAAAVGWHGPAAPPKRP